MVLLDWFWDQKLSDWVQGLGSLAAAAAAVGIALRQETADRRREESARALRRQVLAAAIAPVLRDLSTTTRIRNGLLQTLGRAAPEEAVPGEDELSIPLPDILMSTIERIDVFGARTAAQVYTLVHRINDYNRNLRSHREWDVPVRTWTVNLRPNLDAIRQTLDYLLPRMEAEVLDLQQPAKA